MTVPFGVQQNRASQSADPLAIQVLGGFAVTRNGVAVELPASARRVTAYVALQDGPVRRTRVAFRLWPDVSDQRAMANLRSVLWRLHNLGLPVLEVRPSTIAVAEGVLVDYRRAMIAATILNGGEPPEEVFVNLYEELLPDEYEDWVMEARERHRNIRLHALERRSATLCAQGRYTEAIDIGLTIVSMDPLREKAHEAVIRAHLGEGNRSEALRQFRAYEHILAEELGVAPSVELSRLVRGSF